MLHSLLSALLPLLALAVAAWLASLWRRDVSLVDSVWSLFLLAAASSYAYTLPDTGPRSALLLGMVALWAVRLSAHITWRHRGQPEDSRYQTIRRNNQPNFEFKSLYLVFVLQAVLAWIVSLPLLAGLADPSPLSWADGLGVASWAFGFTYESLADWQLAQFKARPDSHGKVMAEGLWRYSRHPNYFGEFCVWWGFYLLALGHGGGWAIASPILMSVLLMRVSGVPMLEKDILARRPDYPDYIRRTPPFFPGRPKPKLP